MTLHAKKRRRLVIYMITALMLECVLLACSSDSNDETVAPSAPTLEINPTAINFSKKQGEARDLTITTDDNTTWKVYDNECKDWLSVSTTEGKGKMTISLTTRDENKKGSMSVELEVKATNSAGSTSKKVRISRDGIDDWDKNWARFADKLIMSYGMACAIQWGDATSYFLYNIYRASEFDNLRNNEDLIAKEATKSGSSWIRRNIPSSGGIEIFEDKCMPNTDYVFVAVAYTSNGTRGQVFVEDFSTKDADELNQPRATVTPLPTLVKETHGGDEGPWYKWDVAGAGTFYITYACASDKLVETMQDRSGLFGEFQEKNGIRVAWNIYMESKKDDLMQSREVHFNKDNTGGREKLFRSSNNTTQWISYRASDKYLQIVTWAFKSNDFSNYSGVAYDVLYQVNDGVLYPSSGTDPIQTDINVGRDEFDDDVNVDGGTNYNMSVRPSSISASAKGGSYEISLTGNNTWSASSSSPSWCRCSPSSGTTPSTLIIQIDKNETISVRNAKITITGSHPLYDGTYPKCQITVTQDGTSEVARDEFGDDQVIDR